MKNFWLKYKKLIGKIIGWYVVGMIFIFIIPIGINWAFKNPSSIPIFAMSWEAKDALSFYGSLLGAAATIFALSITISFTVKSQREERKLSIKPRLDSKWQHYSDRLLNITEESGLIFVEYNRGCVISGEDIPEEIQNILNVYKIKPANSDEITDNMEACLYEAFKDCYDKYTNNHFPILYQINNYGAGNAIEVELKINECIVCPPFCIATDEPKKFLIIFNEDLLVDDYKEINVSLTYTDICSVGKYTQIEKFTLFKTNNEFQTVRAFEDKLSAPQ